MVQEAQREQEEKQQKKPSKAKEEEQQQASDNEDVGPAAGEAKGNSVSAAPVTNLAAGVQLGFTPSTAGNIHLALNPYQTTPHRTTLHHTTPHHITPSKHKSPLSHVIARITYMQSSVSHAVAHARSVRSSTDASGQ